MSLLILFLVLIALAAKTLHEVHHDGLGHRPDRQLPRSHRWES